VCAKNGLIRVSCFALARRNFDEALKALGTMENFNFPPVSTWLCFTDQVLHGVLSGQYMLEQTFYLPVQAMHDPEKSPLRILEEITRRSLAEVS